MSQDNLESQSPPSENSPPDSQPAPGDRPAPAPADPKPETVSRPTMVFEKGWFKLQVHDQTTVLYHFWQAGFISLVFLLIYLGVAKESATKLDGWLIVARNLRTTGTPSLVEADRNANGFLARLPIINQRFTTDQPPTSSNCIRLFESQALQNLSNLTALQEEIREVIRNSRSNASARKLQRQAEDQANSSEPAPADANLGISPDPNTSLAPNLATPSLPESTSDLRSSAPQSSPEPSILTESRESTATSESPLEMDDQPLPGNNGADLALTIAQVRGLMTDIHLDKVELAEEIRIKEAEYRSLQTRLEGSNPRQAGTRAGTKKSQGEAETTATNPAPPAAANASQPTGAENSKQELENSTIKLEQEIKSLNYELSTIDTSLSAVRTFMSQLGIRDASPVEIDRLAEQVDLLEERIITAGDIARYYYVRYRASAATASVALLAAGICLFFVAKAGWEKADNRLINALFCTSAIYVLCSNLPNLFLYEENFNKNLDLYLNYVNLLGETCTVFSTGVARQLNSTEYKDIAVGVLIHQVDERMRRLNLLNVRLDRTRISDFRLNLDEIESAPEAPPTTPTAPNTSANPGQ